MLQPGMLHLCDLEQKPADTQGLATILGIRSESCVSIIGAGGKTTTMLSLAFELAARGYRPVVTTTTKMWPPEGPQLLLAADVRSIAPELLSRHVGTITCISSRIREDGKLEGITPEAVCVMASEGIGPLLVEADGAASRSIKAHCPGEPVVPICSSDLLVVAGVDVVGLRAGPETVHRTSEYERVTGGMLGETVGPEHVARALIEAAKFRPPAARLWYVLNKVDGTREWERIEAIVGALRRSGASEMVLLVSRGSLVGRGGTSLPEALR